MSYSVIHRGMFASRGDSSIWTITILLNGHHSYRCDLDFPGREPLMIEWPVMEKEEPLCGSTAILKVLSPGDRTFVDLYTVKPGQVLLEVRRDNHAYWVGSLDPEQYEEPYTMMSDYEVTLPFSDFGILQRKKWEFSGQKSLRELLLKAQDLTGWNGPGWPVGVNTSYVSTSLSGASAGNILDEVFVNGENFVDEDGEWKSVEEMVSSALQPLGLRLVQRYGEWWVYDLHGLRDGSVCRRLEWKSDDQVLGVDKAVNDVVITFSPYANDGKLLDSEVGYTGHVDPSAIYTGPDYASTPGTWAASNYFTFYDVYKTYAEDRQRYSFTIFTSASTSDGAGVKKGAQSLFFHIEPIYDGEETDGVAWFVMEGIGPEDRSHYLGTLPNYNQKETVLTTYRRYLPPLDSHDQSRYLLRLTEEVLLEAKCNPFTEASDENESYYDHLLKSRGGFVQIPLEVTLYDREEGGIALYHYDNRSVRNAEDGPCDVGRTLGEWQSGSDGSNGRCWLSWYDIDDIDDGKALDGWTVNKHTISLRHDGFTARFKEEYEGQYIPYPPEGGWIEVKVKSQVRVTDWTGDHWELKGQDAMEWLRWQLYKAPEIEIVENKPKYPVVEQGDKIYSGVINVDALEDLEIDTICGTLGHGIPTARGLYRDLSGRAIKEVVRGGRTGQPEQLLIGTLYSQYAERHVVLTGTAFLDVGGLTTYQEASQASDIHLLLTGELQDVDMGTSEVTAVELSRDEYDRV